MIAVMRTLMPVVFVVLGGFFFWALNTTKTPRIKPINLETVPVVESQRVQPRKVTIPVVARGLVSASEQLVVVVEAGGRALEVSPALRVGGRVKRGQWLLRLDDTAMQHDITRVKARVGAVRERYDKMYAEVDVERSLYGEASAFLKNQLKTLGAQLSAAQADLRLAKSQLEKTVVNAPFDAEVHESFVVAGQQVRPGARIAALYGDGDRHVRLPLTDRQLRMVQTELLESRRAMLNALFRYGDSGVQHYWQGYVFGLESEADPRTGLIYVRARIEKPKGVHDGRQWLSDNTMDLKVGQLLEARIEGRSYSNMVVLPREVVDDKNRVWLMGEDYRLHRHPVKVLYKGKGIAYIHQSFSAGDRVVMSPLEFGFEGMRVLPQREES